jgi:hypothetical protein
MVDPFCLIYPFNLGKKRAFVACAGFDPSAKSAWEDAGLLDCSNRRKLVETEEELAPGGRLIGRLTGG